MQAYKQLKEIILSGELQNGEKLKQEMIAERLGISRMPLHKAFQMLESEYLIEYAPRRGYFVKTFSFNDIIEAFECREVLEGLAARKIAEKKEHKIIAKELEKIFKPFEKSNEIDVAKYAKADQQFHNKIRAYSSIKLLDKLDTFSNYLKTSYKMGLVRSPKDTLLEHFEIIAAIEKGDAKLAEKLIKNHTRKSIEILIKEKK